jgi:hypothetical protein
MTRASRPVEAARAVDGTERRPPRVGKRCRVFHKLPPASSPRSFGRKESIRDLQSQGSVR